MPRKLTDKQEASNNIEDLEICSTCHIEPIIDSVYTLTKAYVAVFCDCGESFKTSFDAVEGLLSKTPKVNASNTVFDRWNKKHREANNAQKINS